MKIVAIIPARLHSTRLPRKVLADIGEMTMIQHVVKQVQKARYIDEVIVATDSDEILVHCQSNGIRAMMTSSIHQSGTDRVAEVASKIEADIVINVQADEPFIESENIDALALLLQSDDVKIGSLCTKLNQHQGIFDYNVVKVVFDVNGKALYFSRQAIPAHRDLPYKEWHKASDYYQHLGLYGFKREVLLTLSSMPQTGLEMSEKLEQLRWLEHGYDIYLAKVHSTSFGIDTEEDLDKARRLIM